MIKVTAKDCLDVGLCLTGQRRFLTRHGFDFREFIKDGIDITRFYAIDDANLKRAIDAAIVRESDNGRRR